MNPKQLAMMMLKNNIGNNPVLNNVSMLAEKGDTKAIEQIARNLCNQRGVNPDEMFNQIRRNFM